MTTEQKFHAAVNVIRSLPQSGSFKPSNVLMLSFYSYYKQATEGKCNWSKPSRFNIVKRAKWDAWSGLGDMPKEMAMTLYVAELHRIVETMSYTDNVAAFFETVGNDPGGPKIEEDLLLVAGDIIKKSKSKSRSMPVSPVASRETSPHRPSSENLHNGHPESEEEYIDAVDVEEVEVVANHRMMNGNVPNGVIPNGHAALPALGLTSTHKSLDNSNRVLDELRRTVTNIEKDLAQLKDRVYVMERERAKLQKSFLWAKPAWWPVKSVSPAMLIAFILWPIVANKLAAAVRRKR